MLIDDMITNFKNPSILICSIRVVMISPYGKNELGEDNGGVFLDVLSSFRSSFYDSRTHGEDEQVPAIRRL